MFLNYIYFFFFIFFSLLFVSTLDGKISALDINNLQEKQWTLEFNEGSMLSSNIHHREVYKFLIYILNILNILLLF